MHRPPVGPVQNAKHAVPDCHRSRDHSSQALRPNLRVELVRDRPGGEVVAHAAKSTRCEHLSAEALASSDHHAVEPPGPRTDERPQNDLIVLGGNANPSDLEIEKLPSLLNYPSVRGVLIQHSEDVAVLAVELGHQAQTFCHVRSKPRLRSASPAAHWLPRSTGDNHPWKRRLQPSLAVLPCISSPEVRQD